MFLDLLRKRRSIRRFTNKPIEQEKIDLLIEALLRAPSSRDLNPWEFILVTDPSTREALAQAKQHGSSFIRHAPLAVVICADPKKCDVWIEDASIATTFVHLAATDLGLGSCWVQIRLRPHDDTETAEHYIARLLDIPEGMVVEAIVAIGYPLDAKPGHPKENLLTERISYEKFGKKTGDNRQCDPQGVI